MDGTESAVSLPAAWYPDPDDSTRLRWWDGGAWTEHVQQLPPPPGIPDPEAEAIAEAFIIKTEIPEAGTWYAETGNRYVPRSTDNSLPASMRDDNDNFDKDDDIGSSWTVESFVLALLPVVAFGLQLFLTTLSHGSIITNNPVLFWIFPVLLVIANPILSTMDKSALVARNVTSAPNGMIGVLPPVYFILRAITVGASSIVPLIIWIAGVAAIYAPTQMLVNNFFHFLATR